MATLPTTFEDGTASVANGSTTVTLTASATGIVYAGDMFADPAQPLVPPQRVKTDAVGNTFELWTGWPGTSLTEDLYEVRITPDTARMQERTRQVLDLLSKFNNTGIGIDAIGLFADRDEHDNEPTGFAYLSTDGAGGGDEAFIYVKNSTSSADWSDPVSFVGPSGVGDIFALSFGVAGLILDDEDIEGTVFVDTITFPAGLGTSRATARVVATADAVFDIVKVTAAGVSSNVGTVTFLDGATDGTVNAVSGFTCAAGDELNLRGPSPQDDTLSGVKITIRGTR